MGPRGAHPGHLCSINEGAAEGQVFISKILTQINIF